MAGVFAGSQRVKGRAVASRLFRAGFGMVTEPYSPRSLDFKISMFSNTDPVGEVNLSVHAPQIIGANFVPKPSLRNAGQDSGSVHFEVKWPAIHPRGAVGAPPWKGEICAASPRDSPGWQ